MRSAPLWRTVSVGVAALAAVTVVAACSTSSKNNAASSSSSTTSATSASVAATTASASATTAAPASPSGVKSNFNGKGSGKFCGDLASLANNTQLNKLSDGSPTSIKAEVQIYDSVKGSLLSSAPGEIKGDLTTLFTALDKVYAALAAANYDFSKVDVTALQSVSTPALQTASQNVDNYVTQVCKISLGGPSAASS